MESFFIDKTGLLSASPNTRQIEVRHSGFPDKNDSTWSARISPGGLAATSTDCWLTCGGLTMFAVVETPCGKMKQHLRYGSLVCTQCTFKNMRRGTPTDQGVHLLGWPGLGNRLWLWLFEVGNRKFRLKFFLRFLKEIVSFWKSGEKS